MDSIYKKAKPTYTIHVSKKKKKQIKKPRIFEDSEAIKDQVSTMDLPIYKKIKKKEDGSH